MKQWWKLALLIAVVDLVVSCRRPRRKKDRGLACALKPKLLPTTLTMRGASHFSIQDLKAKDPKAKGPKAKDPKAKDPKLKILSSSC